MAAKAGIDPVEFRLKNLADARMIRTLKAAAAKFGWAPKAAPSGRGVGVACGIDAGTYDTLMVEVTVDKATGVVRVKRVVCAQDQGVVVNPAGSLQQVEGCITMGLGYTFSEEVRFKGGEVLDKNFDTYSLPRFSQVPQIDTVFIDAPEVPAQGCGEPAIVPLGAAVANAIYDAVGARLFQMPMTPARVLAAMKRVTSEVDRGHRQTTRHHATCRSPRSGSARGRSAGPTTPSAGARRTMTSRWRRLSGPSTRGSTGSTRRRSTAWAIRSASWRGPSRRWARRAGRTSSRSVRSCGTSSGAISHSLKAASVRKELEDSLRRLETDVIDLYQIHWSKTWGLEEPAPDIEEGWSTLAALQKEGKVRHIAVSNFDIAEMDRIRPIAPIASLQPPYSMLRRGIEADAPALLPGEPDRRDRVLADGRRHPERGDDARAGDIAPGQRLAFEEPRVPGTEALAQPRPGRGTAEDRVAVRHLARRGGHRLDAATAGRDRRDCRIQEREAG